MLAHILRRCVVEEHSMIDQHSRRWPACLVHAWPKVAICALVPILLGACSAATAGADSEDPGARNGNRMKWDQFPPSDNVEDCRDGGCSAPEPSTDPPGNCDSDLGKQAGCDDIGNDGKPGDDGSDNDGADDNSSGDDGWADDGSGNDGSGDDGSGDDGWGDDGWGDDGSGGDGSGGDGWDDW
jgi:hypothetical protein